MESMEEHRKSTGKQGKARESRVRQEKAKGTQEKAGESKGK